MFFIFFIILFAFMLQNDKKKMIKKINQRVMYGPKGENLGHQKLPKFPTLDIVFEQ